MSQQANRTDEIAVLGLWHLGSVSAAGWMQAGRRVLEWDPAGIFERASPLSMKR